MAICLTREWALEPAVVPEPDIPLRDLPFGLARLVRHWLVENPIPTRPLAAASPKRVEDPLPEVFELPCGIRNCGAMLAPAFRLVAYRSIRLVSTIPAYLNPRQKLHRPSRCW